MWSSTICVFVVLSIFVDKIQPEVPQLFDYLNGFYLDCYECHSNRPGCGEKVDWILMRWKRCVAPGGSKCVKIIERSPDGEINYVRGCINQIEAVRPEMPTVRENGCWTGTAEYVGLAYRPCLRKIISLTAMTTTDSTTSGIPSELDLAFIIDATSSMSSYIKSAQDNMQKIIHDIILSEKCLLNAALVLYRDHPPQDTSFVIRVHNFTDDVEEAKKNIDAASASGGGDGPEAMAPALHAAVHTLSWRENAVKIAVLIADAPPHGLDVSGDSWPNGDPSGHDPVECVDLLAEKSITLYTIGCEPAATPYRDFLMALAFKTGGQYIPLASCANLASVIVGSAKEEISSERLIAQVHEEVMREAALRGGQVDETELTRRIHEVMQGGGVKSRRLRLDNIDGTTGIPPLTPAAEQLSTLKTLKEVREKWTRNTGFAPVPTPVAFGGLFGAPTMLGTFPTAPVFRKRTRTRAPTTKKRLVKVKATPKAKPPPEKKVQRKPARGSRRSLRIALTTNTAEEESTDSEAMETTAAPIPVAAKPATIKTEVSNISLKDDELLDISQTRRLVRKCVARNKLKSG